jgi:hypothetical protein
MPDGEADRFKPDTREGNLVCVVPDCPSPLLTARGGATGRRHHWAHRSAPNPRHEPESLHSSGGGPATAPGRAP